MLGLTWDGPSVPRTKLSPPSLPPDFVSRPRIDEQLTRGAGRSLTLVCAPAGFGKSIALAGWLRQDGRPRIWIGLDEFDNDLTSFISQLVSALEPIAPGA